MNKQEKSFVRAVKEHYKKTGRRHLPWRRTNDPYRILVSEIMLQQTQVDRVFTKYETFLERFPDVETLSRAPLGEVLRMWQGLGYNRRAKLLHECARVIARQYDGIFPRTYEELRSLPGIGPYTAGAVLAFAFNKPVPIIETNIRSVYLHHFYKDATDVEDKELLLIIERTLDEKNPRTWYAALMDYGSFLKKSIGNPNIRSKHYVRQSTFKGSDRQIRGAILKHLVERPASREELINELRFEDVRVDAQLNKLLSEGMVVYKKKTYMLP